MSLYNALFESNKLAPILALLSGVDLGKTGRYRDAFLRETEGGILLGILTRNGGGNREPQAEAIEYMRSLPTFVEDADDDFDSTYASFYFKMRDEKCEQFARLALNKFADLGNNPMERFKQLLDDMKSDKVTPDTIKAHEVGKGIVEQMEKVLMTGSGVGVDLS